MEEKSNRQLKLEDFRNKRKLQEEQNQNNKRQRTQDQHLALYRRNRQNNFQLVHYSFPKSRPHTWNPTDRMFEFRNYHEYYETYPSGKERLRWIRSLEDLRKLRVRLEEIDEFSLDVECHMADSRSGFICIIQIGTYKYGDFLVGAIELHESIEAELKGVLEDPQKLKIMHGCEQDVLWLQRDFNIFLNGVADSQVFWNILKGVHQISYKDMCHETVPYYDHFCTNETLSDWTLRPETGLTKSQEKYARNDVHVLLRIFDRLRWNYRKERALLLNAFLTSNQKTESLYHPPRREQEDLDAVSDKILTYLHSKGVRTSDQKSPLDISNVQYNTLRALVEWRRMFAKMLDKQDDAVLTPFRIFRLVELERISHDNIDSIVGNLDKVGVVINKQKTIIYKILTAPDPKRYVGSLKNLMCHNCLLRGHGPAVFCPYPEKKINYTKFLLLPENRKYLENRYVKDTNYFARKYPGKPRMSPKEYIKNAERKVADFEEDERNKYKL